MKARDIMTRNVVTVDPDMPIPDVARLFRRSGVTGAPVLENGTLIGIVTEIDLIARHARPHYPIYLPLLDAQIPLGGQREYLDIVRHILATTARDIMTTPVKTCTADTDIEEVATLMVESKANPVPVLENDVVVGILSHTDLLRALEIPEERNDVSAG